MPLASEDAGRTHYYDYISSRRDVLNLTEALFDQQGSKLLLPNCV